MIEAVAVMDQIKEQTLEYLRTRKQFGVPIGKLMMEKYLKGKSPGKASLDKTP